MIVKELLELPPIVHEGGRREVITKSAIRVYTRTACRNNVDNWLREVYDPLPEHQHLLEKMLAEEKAKRNRLKQMGQRADHLASA